MLFALVALEAGTPVSFPIIRALFSSAFSAAMQGRALGVISIVEIAAAMLFPSVGDAVWSRTVNTMPSATFFTFGGICAAASFSTWALVPPRSSRL